MVWGHVYGNESLPVPGDDEGQLCFWAHPEQIPHVCTEKGHDEMGFVLGASIGCGVRVCKAGLESFQRVFLWLGETVLLRMPAWLTLLPRCSSLTLTLTLPCSA